jgi:hypothetical protein
MSDFYQTKIIKTRKHHLCCSCGSLIPLGHTCNYNQGIFEDEWFRNYICQICVKFLKKSKNDNSYDYCWLFDELDYIYGVYFLNINYIINRIDFRLNHNNIVSIDIKEFLESIDNNTFSKKWLKRQYNKYIKIFK